MTSCDEGFSFFEFKIFNRWGELIYTTNQPKEGWNGTYKNTECEIGLYVYYLEYTKKGIAKKEMIKGQVTLIR